MYNRYLQQTPDPPEPPLETCRTQQDRGLLDGLTQRIGSFHIDTDTLVLLAIVWFVLQDNDGELDTELLIMIGVLFLLGM